MKSKSLPYGVTIWVPAREANEVTRQLVKAAGGATQEAAWGSWTSPTDGELVSEPITKVTVFFDNYVYAEVALDTAAEYLLATGEQEVLVELTTGGTVYRELLSAAAPNFTLVGDPRQVA